MLRDRIKGYYIDQDFNCAEAVLHAANDEYALNIAPEAFRLVGGFGGGMGCGHVCGALSGGIAAIGQKFITEKAHSTSELKAICVQFVQDFNTVLGSENCEELKAKFKKDPVRCLEAVWLAADVLENVLNQVQENR